MADERSIVAGLKDYLDDLELLYTPFHHGNSNLVSVFKTKDAKEYVMALGRSKPETLLSDKLLKPIMRDAEIENFPEGRMGGGWVDFILPSSKELGLPVALELKPLHKSDGSLESLEVEYNNLKEQAGKTHTNQIIRYILGTRDPGNRGVDYVVLTNLKDVFIFDKGCIREFGYVKKETFREFIEGASVTKNIYDYLRRTTEDSEKRDLDKQFFKDLKKWFELLSSLEWIDDPQHSSVLLLNKLVFALTLEDFMIIDYRKTWDMFSEKFNSWNTKGPKKVLKEFFEDLDEFLYEYYDTELFVPSSDILSKLKDSRENYQNFLKVLGKVAGFTEDPETFSGGLYSYSFRLIDEDVFGKSYEMFLAENRKDEGIYYTPKAITGRMASKLIGELFGPIRDQLLEHLNANKFEEALEDSKRLTGITIIDPACGSGAFLISVLREISTVYQKIKEKTEWAHRYQNGLDIPHDVREKMERIDEIRKFLGFNDNGGRGLNREAISKLVLRHIYGADLDSMALSVAKVNLWKETVKINPGSYHFQSLPESINHILPDLKVNFINGNSVVTLPDDPVVKTLSGRFKEEIRQMVKMRREYLEDPSRAEIPEEIEGMKRPIREELLREFQSAFKIMEDKTLFYPLEFFFLYFDEKGELLEGKKGFSGVISNPPWNNLKSNAKEFASKHPEVFGEGITKFSLSGKEFKKLFEGKLQDGNVRKLWDSYQSHYSSLSNYVKETYKLQYSGDYSYQKVFMEKFMEIARDGFAILIPSNFHTDEGSYLLRKEIMDTWEIRELISFENRGKAWFSGLHAQFKFDMLVVSREKTGNPFKARFYVSDEKEIEDSFDYPVSLINLISPEVLGITEFRSEEDIPIARRIRSNHKTLKEMKRELKREFDEANDADLFSTKPPGLILYEGKTINQYDMNFSTNRFWVDETRGRKRLLKKSAKRVLNGQGKHPKGNTSLTLKIIEDGMESRVLKLDYEMERLVLRRIGSSTNERSMIAAVVPPRVFLMDNLQYIIPFKYEIRENEVVQTALGDYIYYLAALFNSFVLDYYIRLRISANLNYFFLYELPIPEVSESLRNRIVKMSQELSSNPKNVEVRAEIEAVIAKEVFQLPKEDMSHILGTFVYGNIDKKLIKKIEDLL